MTYPNDLGVHALISEHHSCTVTFRCEPGGRKAIAQATCTSNPLPWGSSSVGMSVTLAV